MKMTETLEALVVCGIMSLVANVVGTKFAFVEAIPGMLILIALAFVGIWLGKVIPGGIPGVAYVVTIGCILTYPALPYCSSARLYLLTPVSQFARTLMFLQKAAGE